MFELWLPVFPFVLFFAWLFFFGMGRGKTCSDCNQPLPLLQSPFTKTKRRWIESEFVCQSCGSEINKPPLLIRTEDDSWLSLPEQRLRDKIFQQEDSWRNRSATASACQSPHCGPFKSETVVRGIAFVAIASVPVIVIFAMIIFQRS